MIRIVGYATLFLLALGTLTFLLLPLLLATLSYLLYGSQQPSTKSALYIGRVWHTRFLPVKHAFRYPLFMFLLDLHEVEDGHLFRRLWPLSLLVHFEPTDHLKNGEGSSNGEAVQQLSERIFNLANTKIGRLSFDRTKHRIMLLTHLRYYGYCFNPVSFYYIVERENKGNTIQCVIGEVSNTPWNEMYCYVLHTDSNDEVVVTEKDEYVQYVFQKKFHVSPFMEMHYNYDWCFGKAGEKTIKVSNSLRQHNGTLQFLSRMQGRRTSMHPYRIAWNITTFPVYCGMIQLWIHYEAARLFWKGVPFQPHPEGAETAASRMIATVMNPLFQIQDWWRKPKEN